MNAKTVVLPRQMWYEEGELQLIFPESWEVVPCLMNGHDVPQITPEQIKAAFNNPVGSPTLRKLARGRTEVAIIFDDISRPTRVADLIPYVLKELRTADIPDDAIRFICRYWCSWCAYLSGLSEEAGQRDIGQVPGL